MERRLEVEELMQRDRGKQECVFSRLVCDLFFAVLFVLSAASLSAQGQVGPDAPPGRRPLPPIGRGPGPPESPPMDESRRARGLFVTRRSDAMTVLVLKDKGGTLVPVDPSSEFRAGDQIKVQIESNFDGFIYVVNVRPGGERCLMFPYPSAANNKVRAGERYEIPPGADAMEFDQQKGTEILQVIMSRERIPYLDDALKAPGGCLAESPSGAAPKPQQAGIVKKVKPVVSQKDGKKLRSRDIVLAAGKDKDKKGSVVAISDAGGNGKLKSGEVALFEIRLRHN